MTVAGNLQAGARMGQSASGQQSASSRHFTDNLGMYGFCLFTQKVCDLQNNADCIMSCVGSGRSAEWSRPASHDSRGL